MNSLDDWLDENDFTRLDFFGGLLVMGVCLAVLVFGILTVVRCASESRQQAVSSSHYATTFRQDGHLFIRAVGGGLLHHPDCQCLTAEMVQ